MPKNLTSIFFAFFILSTVAAAEEINSAGTVNKSEKVSSSMISVDVVEGKIGDINYRDSIDEIQKSIGNKRIKKSTEDLEGNPSDVFIIDIDGHKIIKHWNATSFTDPAFKMQNGLGIGAKIKDFKKQYGKGEIVGGEGTHFCFKSQDPKYYFCIPDIDMFKDDSKLENTKVKNIWVW